jgi:hypothetical protein
LFSCSPEKIRTIKLSYAKMPAENLELSVAGNRIQLRGAAHFDTAAAVRIFQSFRRVFAERFLDRFPAKQKDSLLNAGYEYSIELQGEGKECSGRLHLFFTSDPERSLAYNPDTGEWLTIQNRGLYPILQRRSALLNR